MKKLLLLAGRLMTFFCLAMVALFVCGFFFWTETEESRLASQVIIIFFSLMGFFVFCLDSTAKNTGTPVTGSHGTAPNLKRAAI